MRWRITSWLKAGYRVRWRATQPRAASCAFFVAPVQHEVKSMLEAPEELPGRQTPASFTFDRVVAGSECTGGSGS
jgi:hypothetical protein